MLKTLFIEYLTNCHCLHTIRLVKHTWNKIERCLKEAILLLQWMTDKNLWRVKFWGDRKMKFLRLFFSAVCRPTIHPTIKNFSWHCPCPTPDVRPPTWGKSYKVGGQSYKVGSILYRCLHFRTKHSSSGGHKALSGGPSRGHHQEGGGRTT